MAKIKIGRNDPCHCGSGKKYKQCHEPLDRAHDDHVRLLRRAQDRLFATLIEATQTPAMLPVLAGALTQYWDGRYTVADLSELDDKEERGADRFLTWLAFDALDADGTTLVERIAAAPPAELELDEYERELLPTWASTRLRPYVVMEVMRGVGARVRDVLTEAEVTLHDHAAAKRLDDNELIFAHLVPIGEDYYIAGAAAQTTDDTLEKLNEFLALQIEDWRLHNPDATLDQFGRERSHMFNHFVLALPRAESGNNLDDLLLRGRVAVAMSKAALGLGPSVDNDDQDDDDEDAADEETDDDADEADEVENSSP